MDIDAAGLITLRKMGRPVTPKSLDNLRKIISKSSPSILSGSSKNGPKILNSSGLKRSGLYLDITMNC